MYFVLFGVFIFGVGFQTESEEAIAAGILFVQEFIRRIFVAGVDVAVGIHLGNGEQCNFVRLVYVVLCVYKNSRTGHPHGVAVFCVDGTADKLVADGKMFVNHELDEFFRHIENVHSVLDAYIPCG